MCDIDVISTSFECDLDFPFRSIVGVCFIGIERCSAYDGAFCAIPGFQTELKAVNVLHGDSKDSLF